jgi:hypothetical protein
MEQDHFWEGGSALARQDIPRLYRTPLCSQQLSNRPYPEPVDKSPHPHITSLYNFNIILVPAPRSPG